MTDKPKLSPAIHSLLAALRRRIRRYVWIEGLAAAVAWLGVAFWASLAGDWFFEPVPAVRIAILGLVGVGLAVVLFLQIFRRAFVPLGDRSMALLLERYFPQFQDRLLTAVELLGDDLRPGECDEQMLAQTCRQAVEPVPLVRLGRVFNPLPLRRIVTAALLLALSVAAFAFLQADPLGIWARRSFLLSEELWPRSVQLLLDGFNDGVAKVAKGSDLDIVARADLQEHEMPEEVNIRYRTEGGARDRKPMNRDGQADPERDPFQQFSYSFRSILAPIQFDILGGDDAIRGQRIEVVENPAIVKMDIDCRYPKYMQRQPRSFSLTGVMQFPLGCRLTIRAKTNKDLVKVSVDRALDLSAKAQVVQPNEADPREFVVAMSELTKDTTLLFTLYDTDGIKSREPVRVTLAAVEDKRPEFAAQLQGIGPAITPQASTPAVGKVTDDYGIANVWYEYTIDKSQAARQIIQSPADNPTEVPLKGSLDVRPLALKPGQRFQLCLKADDHCNLVSEPNIGQSDRWLLDVVTPAQLRTMLQARELMLRQRFEAIIQDMVDTRNSLVRMEFRGTRAPRKPSKADEPGEKVEPGDVSPQRLLAQRELRVQGAMQNSRKDAQEVLGVAQAFDDIRAELINNRIDTEELKTRLEEKLAFPLRRIGGERFLELDRRLDQLQAALDNIQAGESARQQTIAQADRIIAEMREVLGRMIELEDFNEAVELLRAIIQSQEKIHDLTKQRQKQKLRNLLEE